MERGDGMILNELDNQMVTTDVLFRSPPGTIFWWVDEGHPTLCYIKGKTILCGSATEGEKPEAVNTWVLKLTPSRLDGLPETGMTPLFLSGVTETHMASQRWIILDEKMRSAALCALANVTIKA